MKLLALLFTLFATTLFSASASASSATSASIASSAEAIAAKYVSSPTLAKTGYANTGLRTTGLRSSEGEAEPTYQIYTDKSGREFCIVSLVGEARLIGYGENAFGENASAGSLPPQLDSILSNLNLQTLVQTGESRRGLRSSDNLYDEDWQEAEPILTQFLHQWPPMDSQCPEIGGERAVPGCNAVSIAEILMHYGHPQQTLADIEPYEKGGVSVSGAAKGEQIDWGLIHGQLWMEARDSVKSFTAEELDATSRLIFLCGASVKTTYGASQSSAADVELLYALTTVWGMDPATVSIKSRTLYPEAVWRRMIYDEVASGRPVIYMGQGCEGGHTYICDGYKEGLFHIDWGWGGLYNGHYDMRILSRGEENDRADQSYSKDSRAVIGIQPRAEGDALPKRVNANVVASVWNNEISMHATTVNATWWMTDRDTAADYTLGMIQPDGKVMVNNQYKAEARQTDQGDLMIITTALAISEPCAELVVVKKKGWTSQIMNDIESATLCLGDSAQKTQMSVETALEEADGIYTALLTFTNPSEREFYGAFYFSVDESAPVVVGLTIPAGGTAERRVNYTDYRTDAGGKSLFTVYDRDLNPIGRMREGDLTTEKTIEVENATAIRGGEGGVWIPAEKTPATIHTTDGRVAAKAEKSVTETFVPLKRGVYAAEGEKVVVY